MRITMDDHLVTRAECAANVKLVLNKMDDTHRDINEVMVILRGNEQRNGLVKDVNILKEQSRIINITISIAVGVLASILSSVIFHVLIS